ncbi:translation initiation factor [Pseudohongiella nitratireducens]|uniref:Translation initiation factor n=1 Tax=Pseudohongiella nitratireducens TaxID=1768907 RepID=A0A917GTB4_9GAMM|nr:translation initiation factor SUI1 [Pseudohongiella nitratireducens]MDF1622426.1 hypothetical protein [Pseudohongiella nitratireducens]GGG56472.1 translation initiation factor [Pseudohongiella nitratireducens]|tara:strand:- start:650 stop:1015 length:366 start_codon:yes stop_codon:yes gene_type:complete
MSQSLKDQLSSLVYSTEKGRLCPECGESECVCQQRKAETVLGDGNVKIRRESKGRKGKGVTLVEGLAMNADELKTLAKALKTHCGCGGAVKAGVIEIQGDKREAAQAFLAQRGIKAKLAGG